MVFLISPSARNNKTHLFYPDSFSSQISNNTHYLYITPTHPFCRRRRSASPQGAFGRNGRSSSNKQHAAGNQHHERRGGSLRTSRTRQTHPHTHNTTHNTHAQVWMSSKRDAREKGCVFLAREPYPLQLCFPFAFLLGLLALTQRPTGLVCFAPVSTPFLTLKETDQTDRERELNRCVFARLQPGTHTL